MSHPLAKGAATVSDLPGVGERLAVGVVRGRAVEEHGIVGAADPDLAVDARVSNRRRRA
jgi:hypothetical protein